MQRIFKYGISVLLLIKSWTLWYTERFPMSLYTRVILYTLKHGPVFWPTLNMHTRALTKADATDWWWQWQSNDSAFSIPLAVFVLVLHDWSLTDNTLPPHSNLQTSGEFSGHRWVMWNPASPIAVRWQDDISIGRVSYLIYVSMRYVLTTSGDIVVCLHTAVCLSY